MNKQHINENNGKTFLLVEVLESGHDFNVLNHLSLLEYDKNRFSTCTSEEDLPGGNWQIIGKASELSEGQAKEMVEKHHISPNYKHYEFRVIALYTAIESLNSLLRSLSMSPSTTLILQKI
jgi:hypothetical protein